MLSHSSQSFLAGLSFRASRLTTVGSSMKPSKVPKARRLLSLNLYFIGDPTAYQSYHKTIVLPVGSVPGTWGLAEMNISDMAHNIRRVDFTEIVRFEVTDESQFDLNGDGEINILDLVLVAQAIGETNSAADVNGDGVVNILDLVQIANHL